MRILDSHLHLWDPQVLEYGWLKGPLAAAYGIDEFNAARVVGATEAAVFVQADPTDAIAEVRWVTEISDAVGVRAIVAGAQLNRGAETTAHLDALAAHDLVVGVRHNIQGASEPIATTEEFLAGARELAARGWSFDACIRASQLPEVAAFAAAVPELRIVLDHLGKPACGTAAAPRLPSLEWVRDITELAEHPLVMCKLSGMAGEARGDWTQAQIEPFLDAAADAFGPERLMWGSDWPVSAIGPVEPELSDESGDVRTYQPAERTRWADAVASWATARKFDVDAIMWGNAAAFYRV